MPRGVPEPTWFAQETEASCLPACLRMIAATKGIFREEDFFRELCSTDAQEGSASSQLVVAARRLGFEAELNINLDLNQIDPSKEYVVAFVDPAALGEGHARAEELRPAHAVVLLEVSTTEVVFLDPAAERPGKIKLGRDRFWKAWEDGTFGCAVIIRPPQE